MLTPAKLAMNLSRQILNRRNQIVRTTTSSDVFISHRGIDTKRTISGLLYGHLSRLGINAFLDCKNMKPGDKLFDHIDAAIQNCRVGVAVFSPHYCDSYFCLHELALLVETKKRIIPIFCDVKPSELHVKDNGVCPSNELQRFAFALEEAKNTVGLAFDTNKGDWSEFLKMTTDSVIKNLIEVDGERVVKSHKHVLQICR